MELYNSLSKKVEKLKPTDNTVSIYSCGPTVYNRAHIGNLSAYIVADVLRRTIKASYDSVKHVMNYTDVDDKTIKASKNKYPNEEPAVALEMLTDHYIEVFLKDMELVGNSVSDIDFIRATDPKTIGGMKALIRKLYEEGFAYVAEDGIYFSIKDYKEAGNKYGQLVDLSNCTLSKERIENDEYDKKDIHDFALWKKKKEGEPAWEFILDGKDITGRPGWHIECSVMSEMNLGVPFDIHTGGIDLKFPHHENEIAQSTAFRSNKTYARFFVHNEHILIDGKKMSKSLNNFLTIEDIMKKDIDPLAFRMLVLQGNYRKQVHFSDENLKAANNRLHSWYDTACLRHQIHDTLTREETEYEQDELVSVYAYKQAIVEALRDDLNTAKALAIVDEAFKRINNTKLKNIHQESFVELLESIKEHLGIDLLSKTEDIDDEFKKQLLERLNAKQNKDFKKSDKIRDYLASWNIEIQDRSTNEQVWMFSDYFFLEDKNN